MSLFGSGTPAATASSGTTAPGGTLFSNPFSSTTPASSAPSSGGLFGGAPTTTSAPAAGGLFGGAAAAGTNAAASSTPASGGLFGSAASSAPSAGTLFGGPAASASPSTGSLFKPAATTAAGGLFGQTTSTAAPAGSNPFLTTNTSGAAPASSLFGQPAATAATSGASLFSQASQAPTGSSLFAASSQAPAGSSLFGTKPAAPTAAANASSMLGAQQSLQQPLAVTGDTYHAAYFHSLLEKNKKRTREVEQKGGFADMPGLQLNLGDIQKRVRELNGMASRAHPDHAADTKAHYLLAASGVNPGSTMRDLRSFAAQGPATAPPQSSISEWDPDSHKYVEQLQQQTTLKMISEGIERAQRDFNAYLEEHVDINWEEQRRKVYEHFGLTARRPDGLKSTIGVDSPRMQGSFGRSTLRRGRGFGGDQNRPGTPSKGSTFGLQKSVLGTPATGGGAQPLFGESADKGAGVPSGVDDRMIRDKEARFAEKVQDLNEARLRDVMVPVLKEFESVEAHPVAEAQPQLCDAYKALAEIVGEHDESVKLRPRHYRDEYLDDNTNSIRSSGMRKRIIDGSRRALEKQFYDALTTLVARNPKEASLGGVPSTINHIRGYVRIRHTRKDLAPEGLELQMIGDDHCWALIFFLIRSGFVREAAQYVADNKTAFQSLDRNFITYISNYVNSSDQRLNRNVQDKISSEYQQRLRMSPENSLDPYRMACYKVIGRCDLSKRSLEVISQGVEDWIWLQFALARESNRSEDFAAEVYDLQDIRETIREIGQRHFLKASEGAGGYGTFFYLQILGGMFEAAVSYLYQYAYVSAVHFAIALNFYGLLRVSDFNASETEILTYNTRELPQINFGRMLGYYTRDFRAAHAVAATDYLCLIHLDADLPAPLGRAQAQLSHEALRELVLETREFAALLGDIRNDGTRLRGAIEARLGLLGMHDQQDFLRAITVQAAGVADNAGRTTDAVLLYHLSEDYDAVIGVINRALAEAVATELGTAPPRVAPVKARASDSTATEPEAGSSFSLTAVDDPATLARNFVTLYDRSAMFYGQITPAHRDTCGLLLRMSEARACVEVAQWGEALEMIASLALLPLQARGSVPAIRAQAQNANALPAVLARLIGPLLLWAMTSIARQRAVLLDGRSAPPPSSSGTARGSEDGGAVQYGGPQFESEARRALAAELVQQARDLMVFAGLMRLRLGKGVWEGIVGGAGELGVY